jgi:methyl-accepting chemotaxis protein
MPGHGTGTKQFLDYNRLRFYNSSNMKTKHLALKVTLNSSIVILAAFIVVQSFAYVRDSLLLESGSLADFFPSFGMYMGTRVIPVLVFFAAIIYLRARPLEKTIRRVEAGESVEASEIDKVKRGMKNFKTLILVLNMLGFTIGHMVDFILLKKLDTVFEINNVIALLLNISYALVYALAQNSINNILFAGPRSILNIVSIEGGAKDPGVRTRGIRSTLFIAAYAMLLFYTSHSFAFQQEGLYADALERGVKENLSVAEIAEIYQEETAHLLSMKSSRLQLTADQIVFPMDHRESLERFDTARDTFIILFFIVLAIAFGVEFASSSEIRSQLKRISAKMRDIHEGEGDLTQRISITQFDEIGELSDNINRFIGQLNDLLKQVAGVAAQVDDSSANMGESLEQASSAVEEMLASAEQVKKNTARQQDLAGDAQENFDHLFESINSISQNVENQASFIEETSSSIEQMAANIRSVSDAADRANEKTSGLEAVAGKGGKSVSDTIASIREIEDASKRVIQIIAMIQDMNEQTNLLAMNAAIEAAHAGQEGKGFAVVANEVKKLAEDGSNQAKQIVAYIDTMNERITNGVRLSDQANTSLTRISHDTKESADIVQEISAAMKEQSSGANQIVGAVASVVEATHAIRQKAIDQDELGKRLQEFMVKLVAVSTEIDVAAGEQIAGDREVVSAVQSVHNSSETNQKAIGTLQQIISRFKLS